MDYYVGLDVSLRSVAVCVIDTDGRVFFERSVACEIEDIRQCLANVPASGSRIGFEAGAMSQHLFFGLQAAGFDVVCMEARQANAALSAMRNKTDKTDARGIAQILRSGWFNPVYMKSREAMRRAPCSAAARRSSGSASTWRMRSVGCSGSSGTDCLHASIRHLLMSERV